MNQPLAREWSVDFARRPVCLVAVAVLGCVACSKHAPARKHDPPPPATLVITSVPSGAAVLGDGEKRLGHTPLTLREEAFSRRRIQLIKDGYEPWVREFVAEPGETRRVHAVLRKNRATIVVQAGLLRGAHVSVNGVEQGKTPLRVDVPAGEKVIVEVKAEGMTPYREEATLTAGESRTINAVIMPKGVRGKRVGWLSIGCDRPASVYLRGKLLGAAPLAAVPLPAGTHHFEVKDATGAVLKQTVVLHENERRELTLRFDQ